MAINIPRRQWSRRPPPNNEPVYLTPEGIQRLENRLALLKRDLPAMIEETARTAAFGDRSDNAEYKEAKGVLRRTHGQIFRIEDQLKRAVMIKSGPTADGKVQLGSTVEVVLQYGEKSITPKIYRIVGPSETDPEKGVISHISPLGAALIGHAEGDVITVRTPRGDQNYEIVGVK